MEIVGGTFIASLMVTFSLLWKRAGLIKSVAVTLGMMFVAALALAYMFNELYPAASPARGAALAQWLPFGGLAATGGPLIGALLAWYSRRRFAQFRAIADGKPYGDGI